MELYFLRHDADIKGAIAALVTEAVELETIIEPHQRGMSAASASVFLRKPPNISPVLAATDSVARLSKAANGTIAATERTNRSTCAWGLKTCVANTTGTKTSSRSKGLCRIS
jgi:hypothetical protein